MDHGSDPARQQPRFRFFKKIQLKLKLLLLLGCTLFQCRGLNGEVWAFTLSSRLCSSHLVPCPFQPAPSIFSAAPPSLDSSLSASISLPPSHPFALIQPIITHFKGIIEPWEMKKEKVLGVQQKGGGWEAFWLAVGFFINKYPLVMKTSRGLRLGFKKETVWKLITWSQESVLSLLQPRPRIQRQSMLCRLASVQPSSAKFLLIRASPVCH